MNDTISREKKWFLKLSSLRSHLEFTNRLPKQCSELGRWINNQIKAFDIEISNCKGLLVNKTVHLAFCSLRKDYSHIFLTVEEKWENNVFIQMWRRLGV